MDTKHTRYEFFCHNTGYIIPVDFSHWGDDFGRSQKRMDNWFQNCPFCHVPDHHETWDEVHEWQPILDE